MKVDFVSSLDKTSKVVGYIASITFCVAVILKSTHTINKIVRSSVKSAISSVKSVAVSLKNSKPVETVNTDSKPSETDTSFPSECESHPSEENKDGSSDDMLK